MTKFVSFTLAMVFGYLLCQTAALPTPDEDRFVDKEYNREISNWLFSHLYPELVGNICKYYNGNMLGGQMLKRNSELINSLLSLPKNMNDAGK